MGTELVSTWLDEIVFPIAEQDRLSLYDDESLFSDIIMENNKILKEKLANELPKIPAFVDFFVENFAKPSEKLVAVIPKDVQDLIDKGQLVFKGKGENLSSILRDVKGNFGKQIDLKKESLSPDTLKSFSNMAMQIQLGQIMDEIKSIKAQIDRVLEGQQDDRIALCESSIRQLINARFIKDESLKLICIANAIKTIEDGKSQILLSMLRDIEYIKNAELGFFSQASQEDVNDRMQELNKNLSVFIKASCVESIQYLSVSETKAAIEPLKHCHMVMKKYFDENTRLKLNSNIGQDLKGVKLEENFWINKFPKIMKNVQLKMTYMQNEQKKMENFSNKEVAND